MAQNDSLRHVLWSSLISLHKPISGAEEFYLQTGAGNIAKLFVAVFTDVGKTTKSETTATNVLDELSLDEARHYQEKTTKYIGRSLKSVTDPLFWYIMKTSNLVRGPWLHSTDSFVSKTIRVDYMWWNWYHERCSISEPHLNDSSMKFHNGLQMHGCSQVTL